MSTRVRLDVLLVERGLAESREKAQRLIRAGLVYTENERLEKPGRLLEPGTHVEVKGSDCPYVSRGGLKLAGALDQFQYDPAGHVAVDLGASTGGFTDCLLQRGARLVYAIDVGRGQLHNKLLNDSRVVSRERTHIDSLEADQFDPRPDLCVADLSFISLRRAYPVVRRILPHGGCAILLVKPQFEVGRDALPRGGVVTDPQSHQHVLDAQVHYSQQSGFAIRGFCESSVRGADGNTEFFICLESPGPDHP